MLEKEADILTVKRLHRLIRTGEKRGWLSVCYRLVKAARAQRDRARRAEADADRLWKAMSVSTQRRLEITGGVS